MRSKHLRTVILQCLTISLGLISNSQAQAPASVTVGWTAVATGRPIAGKTTVTRIVTGPPVWGYRITGKLRVDRVVIDLDAPCDAPKSSGAPTITPPKGPSQHYVLSYAIAGTTRTISISCDGRQGGNATFTMLGFLFATKKLIARSSPATVDGPKK